MTATLASDPQGSLVYAIFDNPPAVFAGLVNQTFASHDMVVDFTYDGVTTGAYTAVLPGMTVLLGSTAGGHDLGITYARKAPTSTKIYTGKTSEVAWADNIHFTVLKDWQVWHERPTVTSNGVAYMMHDIAYSDQHTNFSPVPVIGGDRVRKLTGASVTIDDFDGSETYVYGSTITGHAWACAGATVTGGTTATPSMSFPSAGRYVVAYTATAANGKTTTTYRLVHIYDDNNPPWNVIAGTITQTFERGGAEFGLTVLGDVSSVRQRTKVILFAEDYYGGEKISFGPLVGSENIIAEGWVENEVIDMDASGGQLQFACRGTHYWLNQIYDQYPLGIEAVAGTPAAWTQMQSLTVDKMLYHFLMWHTTALNCVDVTLTGYTREWTRFEISPGTIWDQIKEVAWKRILALPHTDAYGRMFVETEIVLHPVSMRSGFPTTASMSADDCESIQVQRVSVPPVSQVILSGIAVSGLLGEAIFALSRGHIPGHYGQPLVMDHLSVSTQTLANELAANLYERENAQYKFFFNGILKNNRMVGICPRQYIDVDIASTDNSRGVAYAGKAIPKSITLDLVQGGAWDISWEAVPETSALLSIDGDIPTATEVDGEIIPGDDWTPPMIPPTVPPPPIVPPVIPSIPPDTGGCGEDAPRNIFALNWTKRSINGTDEVRISNCYFPCTLRPATYINGGSAIAFDIWYTGDAAGKIHVYGMSGDTRIISGSVAYSGGFTVVTFGNPGELAVTGFQLELEGGGGDPTGGTTALTLLNDAVAIQTVNTGSITINSLVTTQVSPEVIRVDISATFVDDSDLLENSVEVFTDFSGVSPISTTVYFIADPSPQWELNGNIGRNKTIYYYVYPTLSGGSRFKFFSSTDGTGTMNVIMRVYYISGPATPALRRITINSSRIYNVCA
jgi:hypothetical protein